MGVLIKDMEMPKSCDVCPLLAETDDYHVCYINEQFIPWEWIDEHSAEQRHPKPSWCPLIEIPPHGRLIDADALRLLYDFNGYKPTGDMTEEEFDRLMCRLPVIRANIDDAPTIIEAEEGE